MFCRVAVQPHSSAALEARQAQVQATASTSAGGQPVNVAPLDGWTVEPDPSGRCLCSWTGWHAPVFPASACQEEEEEAL